MRRQLKPFVTEYRGTGRRTKDLPGAGDLQPDAIAQRSRSYAEAERAFHTEASDDSYEAALRAADALFAAPAPDERPLRDEPPRAKPPAAPVQAAAEAAAADARDTELPTTEPLAPFAEREPMAPPRRILQAIEPPAEDRFAALEAERAPKRRGRKPGSKNKPKLVVGDDWGAAKPALATIEALATRKPSARAALPSAQEPSGVFAVVEPATIDSPEDEPMPQLRGRNEKFNWKRDGLRPGERWKRRLPKAAR